MRVSRQFLNFVWVGAIGFAVDGGVLSLLSLGWGMNIHLARAPSFLIATLSTWWLNRKFAFSQEAVTENGSRAREYGRYVSVQIGGGLINYGVFSLCIVANPDWQHTPLLPLAVGSAFGLGWNFTGAKVWAFTGATGQEG